MVEIKCIQCTYFLNCKEALEFKEKCEKYKKADRTLTEIEE